MVEKKILNDVKENTDDVQKTQAQLADAMKEEKKEKLLTKRDILKKISSGTALRNALDDIARGNKGALVVIDNSKLRGAFQGGFKINAKFTSERLSELAKMDGAIILSDDFKKILFANTLITPSMEFTTSETGTRHQAAERIAKQINGLVIAVSERKNQITIYYGHLKYVLQESEELLRRATETLQILEKQRDIFDELMINVNLLEINNLVSVGDVCRILERIEMIRKMGQIINEYIIELGRDGLIVRMRMREITQGMDKQKDLIIKDYITKSVKAKQFFDSVSFEELLDLKSMAEVLFGKSLETSIVPKGYRILSKTNLNNDEIIVLIKYFKNLEGILHSDKETLQRVLKDSSKDFQEEFNTLREHVMVGKKI